jgi:hypothetical protein
MYYCFDHGLDGRWIGSTVRDSLSMIIPMFFSSYAINCYVVGSCHGLSWFSTYWTLLWTSIFFLKLFVVARRLVERSILGKYLHHHGRDIISSHRVVSIVMSYCQTTHPPVRT